jgi:IS66 Orf2 like protein
MGNPNPVPCCLVEKNGSKMLSSLSAGIPAPESETETSTVDVLTNAVWFRGRKANLIKVVFWDGMGLCLFTKRLEQSVFLWPSNVELGRTLALTSTQLSALIEGIDWRLRWPPSSCS